MIRLSRGWIFWSILAGVSALFLGLTLVWLNIGRLDTAYQLKLSQTRLDAKEAHVAKLQVERDNLVSPFRLREKAREYGLGPAKPGQMRRLEKKE